MSAESREGDEWSGVLRWLCVFVSRDVMTDSDAGGLAVSE